MFFWGRGLADDKTNIASFVVFGEKSANVNVCVCGMSSDVLQLLRPAPLTDAN